MTRFLNHVDTDDNHTKANRIQQGDFVYCKACAGALDFWGIYADSKVISIDGGGTYLISDDIYLGDTFKYWTIIKRIKCDKALVEIREDGGDN